jgi:hypothetical protein
MNTILQAALEKKKEHDAVSAEAFSFLDALLGIPTDATPKRGIKSSIVLTYENIDQGDIELAADMMSHQFNQFNWTASKGMITVEWGC